MTHAKISLGRPPTMYCNASCFHTEYDLTPNKCGMVPLSPTAEVAEVRRDVRCTSVFVDKKSSLISVTALTVSSTGDVSASSWVRDDVYVYIFSL